MIAYIDQQQWLILSKGAGKDIDMVNEEVKVSHLSSNLLKFFYQAVA